MFFWSRKPWVLANLQLYKLPWFCRDFCDFHKSVPCFFYHFLPWFFTVPTCQWCYLCYFLTYLRCTVETETLSTTGCLSGDVLCWTDQCISASVVCDGISDCYNNTDEHQDFCGSTVYNYYNNNDNIIKLQQQQQTWINSSVWACHTYFTKKL